MSAYDKFEGETIDVEYTVNNEVRPETPPLTPAKAPFPRLHLILFLATFGTTTLAGTMMEADTVTPLLAQLHKGLPFSITLLTILLCHEFGHYFMARFHRVEATLPYFIPAPSIIGTFGAVIQMKSPISSKRALFDIGAAGPLAGMMTAIPATLIGLHFSTVQPLSGLQGGISLGSSLLFSFLSWLVIGGVPANYDLILHPMAFAGWIGFLVTMLNLIPVGQLDGGHIVYALLGRDTHRRGAYLLLPLLFVLGMVAWRGWLIWCVLLLFVTGTKHPPTYDEDLHLDRRRQIIGWLTLLIFALTFTPNPFSMNF